MFVIPLPFPALQQPWNVSKGRLEEATGGECQSFPMGHIEKLMFLGMEEVREPNKQLFVFRTRVHFLIKH